MRSQSFTANLFRSRAVALCHVAMLFNLAALGVHTKAVPNWLLWAVSFYWLAILIYNTVRRHQENRLPWAAAARLMAASKAVAEGRRIPVDSPTQETDSEAPHGYCFECAKDNHKIIAAWMVPAGEGSKPLCLMHARAQHLENVKKAEQAKTESKV